MPTQAFDTTMIYPISNQISRKRVGGTGGTRGLGGTRRQNAQSLKISRARATRKVKEAAAKDTRVQNSSILPVWGNDFKR